MVSTSSFVLQFALLLCVATSAFAPPSQIKVQNLRGLEHTIYWVVHVPGGIFERMTVKKINEDPKILPNITYVHETYSDTMSIPGTIDLFYKGRETKEFCGVAGSTTSLVSPVYGQLAAYYNIPWMVTYGNDAEFLQNPEVYSSAINLYSGWPGLLILLAKYLKAQGFMRVGMITDNAEMDLAFRREAMAVGIRIASRQMMEGRAEVGISTREQTLAAVRRMKDDRVNLVVTMITKQKSIVKDSNDAFEHENMTGANYQYFCVAENCIEYQAQVAQGKKHWNFVQGVQRPFHEPAEPNALTWNGSPGIPPSYQEGLASLAKAFSAFVEQNGGPHAAGSVYPGLDCSVERKPWDFRCNSTKPPGWMYKWAPILYTDPVEVFAMLFHAVIFEQHLDPCGGGSPTIVEAFRQAALKLKHYTTIGGAYEFVKTQFGSVVRATSGIVFTIQDRCVPEEGCIASKRWVEGERAGELPIKFFSRNDQVYDVNFFSGKVAPTIWMGNTTTKPKDYLSDACGIEYYVNVSSIDKECLRCPMQTVNPPGDGKNECELFCYSGWEPAEDNKQCVLCTPGKTAKKGQESWEGAKKCEPCPKGTASVEDRSSCAQCVAGSFANTTGASSCKRCERGSYAGTLGAEECNPCPEGFATLNIGAITEDACVCPEGTYRSVADPDKCIPCSSGMVCALGSAQAAFSPAGSQEAASLKSTEVNISLAYGFYSKVSDPMVPYQCMPEEACPGGLPGTCQGKRNGFLCTGCIGGYIPVEFEEESDEGCMECTIQREAYIVAAVVGGLVALMWQLKESKGSPLEEGPVFVELKGLAGQALMFLQVIGAVLSTGILLGEPMTTFMEGTSQLVSFKFIFQSMPCIAHGLSEAVAIFTMQLFLPVAFLIALTIAFVTVNAIRPKYLMLDGLLNSFGEILIEFYVSIAIAMLSPFNCYPHPHDKSSLVDTPQILCWEGDHWTLVGLSVLGFLMYTASTLAITCFATWYHPRAMLKNDIGFLVRCNFLFNRWDPKAYWFSVVTVIRNCLLAVFPMVIPDQGLALGFMKVTLLLPLMAMAAVKPRRTPSMNALDAHMSCAQMLILAVGPDVITSEHSSLLSWILMLLFVSVGVVVICLLALKGAQFLTRNRSPGSWAFDVFLDHHGGPGGSTARALHLVLSLMVKKGKLFYDIDSMRTNGSVGVVMDAAKLSSRMIIVHGSQTWCRTWSAAAVSCACQWKVKLSTVVVAIIKVDFADFEADLQTDATESQLPNVAARQSYPLTRVIDIEGMDSATYAEALAQSVPLHRLKPYGVGLKWIRQAVKEVLELEQFELSLDSDQHIDGFLNRLHNQMQLPCDNFASLTTELFQGISPKQIPDNLLLTCDHGDSDAISTSRLFNLLLTRVMGSPLTKAAGARAKELKCIQDIDLGPDQFATAVDSDKILAWIVLITSGTFQSATQLLRLGYLQKHTARAFKPVPIVINDVFSLPAPEEIKDVAQGIVKSLGKRPRAMIACFLTAKGADVTLGTVRLVLLQLLNTKSPFCCHPNSTSMADIEETLASVIIQVGALLGQDPTPAPEGEFDQPFFFSEEERAAEAADVTEETV